ncbi:hypothetical protein [Methanomethylovorans sp.]|uniref:hypothetical protein n=1 Tax=Methanomethylovorans sp. TaxID=2758717 RepID=UPI00351C4398
MRMLITLLVLIAFSTGAQACWPPVNIVDNSTNEVEPVKVAEPVEETQDTTDEEDEEDGSNNSNDVEETEVVAPIVDSADEYITEEAEVVEVPDAESAIPRSSGYGEAHVIELDTTESVQEQDSVSHPVETKPVMLVSIITGTTVEQKETSNVTAVDTANNKGSYVSAGITLALIVLIVVSIYYIRK